MTDGEARAHILRSYGAGHRRNRPIRAEGADAFRRAWRRGPAWTMDQRGTERVALNLVNRPNKRRQTADQVSELTTNRLSVYLRCLNELDAAGTQTISSQALAEQFHLNAAQIRKDLAYFGEFGVRGVGYYVKDLRRHLRQILGLDRHLRVAIMGAGNLGLALADYPGFRQEGFEIAALFDAANEKIGHESRSGVPIYDIKELKRVARRERLDIAVIAVPAPHAQPVVDQVITAGVKAILNFSPGALQVPPEVKLKSVDLTVSLESLSFYLAQGEGPHE
jgi:redox-sensing transcriptional repressor